MKTKQSVNEIKVSEVMTRRVEMLASGDTIKDAVNLMLDCKLSTVPVVDGECQCIGMLSRSDLTEMFMQEDSELSHVLDSNRLSMERVNRSLDTVEARIVKEFMTYDVATVHSNQTLTEACQQMARHQIHHLPVVDEDDKVIGIISAFDVVLAVAAMPA